MKKKLWLIVLCALWAAGILTGLIWYLIGSAREPEPGYPSTVMTEATTVPTTQATTVPETTAPTVATVPETTESEVPEETEPEPPGETEEGYQFTSKTSFVYDLDSDTALHGEGDLDDRIYPASITKLFTAYVALKYADPELVITAGNELDMVASDSSVAYIEKGHQLTVAMLIEGMLLPSGNDAAHILAAGVAREASGDPDMAAGEAVGYFMDLVNAEAQALGMTGTHFVTPDGYHAEDHYTTCRDLITIARLSLNNSIIRSFAGRREEGVTYASGQTNHWKNTNLLLHPDSDYYCPAARGLKTGYTSAAGSCLLSAFLVEERYVLIGVFGSSEYYARFSDTLYLYDQYIA